MAEKIEIVVPKKIYEEIEKRAEELGMKLEDVVLRAIVKLLDEEYLRERG